MCESLAVSLCFSKHNMKGVGEMNVIQHSKLFLKRNGATILTCVGSVGVVATSVMAVKATPKAVMLLEKAKEEKGEDLTLVDKVRVAGPAYIPAAVVGVSTIACIFGANVLNKRQQASLMSAYALLDKSFKEYKAKVKELYGEEADQNVREEIAKDKYEEGMYPLEDNKVLFYEEYSQQYFESTMEDVIKAEYLLNRDFQYHGIVILNDFYKLLKLPETEFGYHLGWSTFWLYESQLYPFIEFRHRKVELEDGMECYIIEIFTEPVPEDYFNNY